MSGTLLTALAYAAALAAAQEELPAPPEQANELRLDENFLAQPAEEPVDVRSFKERRRAARSSALGWLGQPLDDRELAHAISQDRDPVPERKGDEGGQLTPDGAELVWNRPSLLTLGRVPNQPDCAQWFRWQAAVLEAREARLTLEARDD